MNNVGAEDDGGLAAGLELTVVVCSLDMKDLLSLQLRALASQKSQSPFEIIVVDNQSTDGTADMVRDFQHDNPDVIVRLISNPDRGLNKSRNCGGAAARSPFVALCDADDIVEPGWVAAYQAASAPDAYLGGSLIRAGVNDAATRRHWNASPLPVLEAYRHHGELTPPGCNCCFPVAMWETLGGFDERLRDAGDETEFFRRAADLGYRYEAVPDAVIRYRLPSTARAVWRRGVAYGRSMERLIDLEQREPRTFVERRWRHWLRLAVTAPIGIARQEGRYFWLHRAGKAVGEIAYRSRSVADRHIGSRTRVSD